MKRRSHVQLMLVLAYAAFAVTAQGAAAQGSISSEMDAINARARANAEAMKGKPPAEVQLWSSGTAEDRSRAATKKSGKCKFSYYTLGDDKGKLLAKAAADECYRNEELKARGQDDQTTNDAYGQWMDHRALTKRAPIQPVQPTLSVQPKQMTCTPDVFGKLRCESH